MSVTRLETPFLEGGIRSTHFFNGRILSREDLQREQEAERAWHERLGRALGAGVASGLEVVARSIGGSSVTDPVVTVRAGLALNGRGQALALDRDVDLSLLPPTATPESGGAAAAGGFAICAPPDEGVYLTGSGVYLLAMAPAQAKQGLAVVSGLGNGGATCNAKERVEGVLFRLVQLKGLSSAELADEARLRNVAAYKFFFAAGASLAGVRDPFGRRAPTPGLTDPALTDCEVPLALLHWTALGGLRWVDLWSVRRQLTRSTGMGPLPVDGDPQVDALEQARSFQFQEHLQSLRVSAAPPVRASDAFRWLPPVGLLPLGGLPGALGFDGAAFFTGFTTRGPLFIEGARVRPLLRLGASFPPITVGDPELVWLYLVRENRQPEDGVVPTQPYLIFALGRTPCQIVPRFDVSHWDYAHYALDRERDGL